MPNTSLKKLERLAPDISTCVWLDKSVCSCLGLSHLWSWLLNSCFCYFLVCMAVFLCLKCKIVSKQACSRRFPTGEVLTTKKIKLGDFSPKSEPKLVWIKIDGLISYLIIKLLFCNIFCVGNQIVTEKTRWYECLGQKLVRTIQKAFSFANHFHVSLRLRWKVTIRSGKPP